MKRILLLVTLALMLAAAMALSGVAQAAPISDKADAQCLKLAIKTLGPSFNPSTYTFHGGTEGNNDFTGQGTADVPDVFCGFGGVDGVNGVLAAGDIFLGGDGNDFVITNNGTFDGGARHDVVVSNTSVFLGGAGDDVVDSNAPGAFFSGGDGNDRAVNNSGTFTGGPGDDFVDIGNPPTDGSP